LNQSGLRAGDDEVVLDGEVNPDTTSPLHGLQMSVKSTLEKDSVSLGIILSHNDPVRVVSTFDDVVHLDLLGPKAL